MKINRLWIVAWVCMLAPCSIAKDYKFWFDLESADTQCFHYGSVPTSVVQGDLDNDGIMDVAVGTGVSAFTYPGKCFILWNGTEYQELLEYFGDFNVIAIEDLDNNGYKDIICREIVFFNQGNREFIADPYKGFVLSAKFADLDGDGILDSINQEYWRNGSDGAMYEFNIISQYFDIVDMNGDGRLDVVCKGTSSPRFFWYENTETEPLFGNAQIINDDIITIPIQVMDYDYDGDDDLLVIYEGIMGFMKNDNKLLPLNFDPLFETIPEGFTLSMGHKIIDLDFDGDWDMFGYNGTEKRFFVVEQIGYRSLQFEFKWISDKVTLPYWGGYFIYQNAGKTYYYFRVMSEIGVGAKGGLYRTPINVQAENAVSLNWEIFQ